MSGRELLYGVLALASAVAGWYYNIPYMQGPGAGWVDWTQKAMVNLAASSALMDLTAGYIILGFFIAFESARIRLRFGWVFILVTIFVSFGTGVALFLLFRERKLRASPQAA